MEACGQAEDRVICLRELGFTYEDAIKAGREAGEELKTQAGPEFFSW